MADPSGKGDTQRVVMVQGASRGLGLEFVRQLAADPSNRVIATCRDPNGASELTALATSSNVESVAMDVAVESSIEAAANAVGSQTDRLDWIINVAGLLHGPGQDPERRLSQVTGNNLTASFQVNAIGPILVARYFEKLLFRGEDAVFASLSARVGSIGDNRLGGWYAYRASKAAQNMLLRTLAVEWGRRRRPITCLALHPGTVDTDLSKPFQRGVDPERLFSSQRAVAQLLAIVQGATPADSGRFIAWDGQDIPW